MCRKNEACALVCTWPADCGPAPGPACAWFARGPRPGTAHGPQPVQGARGLHAARGSRPAARAWPARSEKPARALRPARPTRPARSRGPRVACAARGQRVAWAQGAARVACAARGKRVARALARPARVLRGPRPARGPGAG
ncbi:uncharacterized protein LOC109704935 [Ananas comosus]|uniref:Uncharacterized protein LOC109704935 n=1 Tax=Ananas comosus TaxID=4615 RepID=A0A6P5ED04_ANACO|nr:uncharacterized protein LOC109704935 [Ananas comosus]